MPNLFRLFKPYPSSPVPVFQRISAANVKPASVLLFYGGNVWTELFGNRVYRHQYRPPAFHAAITVGSGEFLNVGKFKTINPLDKVYQSTRRVDVVEYQMLDTQRQFIESFARGDTDDPGPGRIKFPTYAFTDYIRFGLKWFKQSRKDFCSENVVELMNAGGLTISDREPYNTAPWHILEYALSHPNECSVKTLWVGKDFV